MTGSFEISEGLLDDSCDFQRFAVRRGDDDSWGVYDWERHSWRRPPDYTRQDAARMSLFLNRQPPGLID